MALNGLSPVPLEKFGGLRLDLDPEEVGNGAVDSLNLAYDESGSRVGCRGGYTTNVTLPAQSAPTTIASYKDGNNNEYFLVNRQFNGGNFAYALYSDAGVGTTVLNEVAGGVTGFSSAAFGTPTVSALYFADNNVYKVVSAAISNVWNVGAGHAQACRYVCATDDGRLAYVKCYTKPDRVYFSDPAAPETIGANNYVDLSPGDGELITGVVLFRSQMFVFKESKFFVFYGTSTDATGNPVFNYRTVNTGVGGAYYSGTSPNMCVGRDGVYFTDGRSVYRTTGGDPVRISQAIDPYLQGVSLPLFGQSPLGTDQPAGIRVRWVEDSLYVILPAIGGGAVLGMFVMDSRNGNWSYWNPPVADLVPGAMNIVLERARGVITSTRQIVTFTSTATTDSGTAITSRVRSGLMDLGSPAAEKVVRQTQITGQGTVSFGWSRDFGASPSLSSVTLGTAPTTVRGLHRVAQQGETLSYTLQSTGAWQANRVVPMVRSVRGAGERTS